MSSNHREPGDPVEEQIGASSSKCSAADHSTCGASPCARAGVSYGWLPRGPRRNTHLCFNLSYRTQMRSPTRRAVLEATTLLRLALVHSHPAAPSALAWVLTVFEECRPLRQRQLPRRDMRELGDNQPRASSQEYNLKGRGPGQAPTIARPARGTSSNPFIGIPRSRVSVLTSASTTVGPLASAVIPLV